MLLDVGDVSCWVTEFSGKTPYITAKCAGNPGLWSSKSQQIKNIDLVVAVKPQAIAALGPRRGGCCKTL